MKIQFISNANKECLFERIDTCHSNPKKSSTTKTTKYITSGYSLFTHCPVDKQKINLTIIEVKIV